MVGTNSYITKLKAQIDRAIIQRDHWKQLAENRNSIVVTEVCPESRSVEEYIVGADNVRALWRLMREYREQITALEAECERLRAGRQMLIGDLERRDATVEALAAELAAIKGQEHAAEQPDTVGVPRKLLDEAESIIDSYAEALKQCHAPGGDWAGEEAAQDDYEHEAGVASELRAILAIAQIQERNQ